MRIARKLGLMGMPLRTLLGLGAAALGVGTCITAVILWLGMVAVADRLDTALKAEERMAGYANLSTQAATLLVVATEAVQRSLPSSVRAGRIEPVAGQIHRTFARLQADVQRAVEDAQSLGLDAQSRYGTQSLGIARMQAMLNTTVRGLTSDSTDTASLQAYIDTFASSFDSLLSQAVNTEVLFRNAIMKDIDTLRQRLAFAAIAIAAASVLLVLSFQFGLVRPQLGRLDRLHAAAQKISQADFAVDLPQTRPDEIGQLYSATSRMAAALSDRQDEIEAEWARLNETIAERTEELRGANARLAEIDENRRRFFADVSHELRTPLTVILMEAQIGRQSQDTSGEAFATIEARAARLNRRIDDLLRVARSESGQLALDMTRVNLGDLMRDVVEEIGAELDNAGMTLQSGSVPEADITGDRNWLRQVIVSLVRNAIRHARDGGAVALAAQRQGKWIEICVTDNGPGIAKTDQARMFDRFEQGSSDNRNGFGIGMALTRWVIESHAGEISIDSPVDRATALGDAPGTKIAVRIPGGSE